MFCSACGKEIASDSNVCGYCGAPVQGNTQNSGNAENVQGYSDQVNNNQQYNNGQANYNNQQYNNGQANYNNQQYNNGQPIYNNQQYNNGQPIYNAPQQYNNGQGCYNQQNSNMYSLQPDNKFNIIATLFTWIWALVKGMWDLFLVDLVIKIILLILTFIPVANIVALILRFIYFCARIVIVGRNANYYYRLKATQKIYMFKAMQDPNLRRI